VNANAELYVAAGKYYDELDVPPCVESWEAQIMQQRPCSCTENWVQGTADRELCARSSMKMIVSKSMAAPTYSKKQVPEKCR
jgi:hypothetical protein